MSTEEGVVRNRQGSVVDDQPDLVKYLWVRDDKDVWRLADVDKVDGNGGVVVKEQFTGAPITLKLQDCHPFDPSHDIDMDDISRMVRSTQPRDDRWCKVAVKN